MDYEIIGGEAFPFLKVKLKPGQSVKAETNAMVAMSGELELSGKANGGVLKSIARKFSGESFFLLHVEAKEQAGWVKLAPFLPGTMKDLMLNDQMIYVQAGSFLAASEEIDVSTKVQGITKTLFSREGLFAVKLSGTGHVFLSSFGGIEEITIKDGQEIIVDNGHLVAWESHLDYEITKGGKGWISSLTSGEMLALRFKGPGKIWIQSRNLQDFRNWVLSFIPKPRSN